MKQWGVQRSDGKWITEPDSTTPKSFDAETDAAYEAGQLNDAAEVYFANVTFSAEELP